MKTVQSKDGTQIAYDVYGSGPALIYITGATCFRHFEPVLHDAQVFASAFSVYNYDRRGRGDSGNTLPYAPEGEIEDIEVLIDAAGGNAFLYGHSSGAALALEAALRLDGKVSRIVLYDASYCSSELEQRDFEALGEALDALLKDGKHEDAIRLFLEGIGMPDEVIGFMRESPEWVTLVALAPTLAYDVRLTLDLPPLERATHLTTPTLIMTGELNPDSIHEVAAQLKQAIPQAKSVQLAGQDHMPDPALVLPILVDFLNA
jgi:pimeloyl-ACP methyl ester carboxylesterase